MDQTSIGKAHWARAKAASLWQQADDLDRNHSGDWRARATRRRGAARLRTEAHRFESIALRLDPELAEEAPRDWHWDISGVASGLGQLRPG
jgi:hypothetical protein